LSPQAPAEVLLCGATNSARARLAVRMPASSRAEVAAGCGRQPRRSNRDRLAWDFPLLATRPLSRRTVPRGRPTWSSSRVRRRPILRARPRSSARTRRSCSARRWVLRSDRNSRTCPPDPARLRKEARGCHNSHRCSRASRTQRNRSPGHGPDCRRTDGTSSQRPSADSVQRHWPFVLRSMWLGCR
jgi:hypothetical protein